MDIWAAAQSRGRLTRVKRLVVVRHENKQRILYLMQSILTSGNRYTHWNPHQLVSTALLPIHRGWPCSNSSPVCHANGTHPS